MKVVDAQMALKVNKPGESLGKKKLKLSNRGKIITALSIVLLVPMVILGMRTVANASESRQLEATISSSISDAIDTGAQMARTNEARQLIRDASRERNLSAQATKTLEALNFIILNEELSTQELDTIRGTYNRLAIVVRNYIGGR